MKFNLRVFRLITAVFFCVGFSLPLFNVRADSSYTGPLFDAHSHLASSRGGNGGGSFESSQEGSSSFGRGMGRRRGAGFFGGAGRRRGGGGSGGSEISNEQLISLMHAAGLSGVALFGPQQISVNLHSQNPNFVYPFANISRDPVTKQVLLNEEQVHFIEKQLTSGIMRGIGEIPLRHNPTRRTPEGDSNPADSSIMLQIYDLAARYNVPVNVHVEHEYSQELERGVAHNRNAMIIWAHVGNAPASLAREMMRRHPNIYADISTRNPLISKRMSVEEQSLTDQSNRLKDEWRSVFEEFPDRFLFGLDIGGPSNRHEMIHELVRYYRSVLGELTPETAEKIAYKNARRLLGLDQEAS